MSMILRFAKGVARGEYKDKAVFMGMVKATIMARERQVQGKSLHGMVYAPELDALCNALHARSPSGYRLLREHLQVRSERSISYVFCYLYFSLHGILTY